VSRSQDRGDGRWCSTPMTSPPPLSPNFFLLLLGQVRTLCLPISPARNQLHYSHASLPHSHALFRLLPKAALPSWICSRTMIPLPHISSRSFPAPAVSSTPTCRCGGKGGKQLQGLTTHILRAITVARGHAVALVSVRASRARAIRKEPSSASSRWRGGGSALARTTGSLRGSG